MKIKLGITQTIYDLNEPEQRQWLKEDLEHTGFFLIEDNWKYSDWFQRPTINRKDLIDLMAAIGLFQQAKDNSILKAIKPKN